MEVTTVSPTPASPTEGDDLCETDVTSVAIHSVTLLIGLCGLAGNGAVLWLLRLKTCNLAIFDLAFTDFLFLFFAVPSALLFLVDDVSCPPILPLRYLDILFQLSVVSTYRVLWMMQNTFMWYKLCWLCCCWKPSLRLVWLVLSFQFCAFFALFVVIPTVTFLCPSHEQQHCRAALISMYCLILLVVAPVFISSTVSFIKARQSSQQQQPKRYGIIIFVTVLLNLLFNLCDFLQQLGYSTVSSQVVFLLTCIHSSIKPFIYFLVGRCWGPCSMEPLQLSLQRVFEEAEQGL
ncbi:mas-related G-protein coupled receptor member X3-like [Passerculus sandwichensis]